MTYYSTHLSWAMACLILALRFLTTGLPLTVAALKVEPELGWPVSLPARRLFIIIIRYPGHWSHLLMLVSWVM